MATASPSQPPSHRRRLFVTLPAAAIAGLVTLGCALMAMFLGGLGAAAVTIIAAVTGALWGAAVVLSLPERLRR